MLNWLHNARPEWLALAFNSTVFVIYLLRWSEFGRILYWLGVVLLNSGLLLIK